MQSKGIAAMGERKTLLQKNYPLKTALLTETKEHIIFVKS